MDQVVRGGFVSSHDLLADTRDGALEVTGRIECAGGIAIEVRQQFERVDGRDAEARVQIVEYRYHVQLTGVGPIFRYDAPHALFDDEDAPAHHHEHHRHEYDVLKGDREGTITCIYDVEQVPTLREVIDEAADWFYAHAEELRRFRAPSG
jgi:hypothetical protein